MSSNRIGDTKIDEREQVERLHQIQTNASIAIPRELFEKLYLSPLTKVKGDLRKTFPNPTPL